jgi:hypothetical protein
MNWLSKNFAVGLLFLISSSESSMAAFLHPGLLHSQADLDRMKAAVAAGQEPTKSGFEVFKAHPQSQATYAMKGPMDMVGRNPTVGQGTYDQDSNAAYQCAIMWCITDDIAYANKSKGIIKAWSSTLKSITGRDAVLMAGLGPFKMVNAAEILRYTNAGWSEADIRQTERHFKEVVYPVIKDFALFANGNWDTAAIKTVMAIGVFCNDRAIFERGLRYYVNGGGDGCLTHYIINEAGQCQESGRDQQHTQLGMAHLGDCCEIAWNQGLNLYAYANNRLLNGFEYTAKYNLGEDVPFVETLDRTGKYRHTQISTNGRGRFRAVYEEIYNHYVNRMGIPAPYAQKAAEKIRPEGPGLPGADHMGFGTLLFSRPASTSAPKAPAGKPSAPGAIVAQGSASAIKLTWVASVGATSYTIKRATTRGGPYAVVAKDVTAPSCMDEKVEGGKTYYYVVSASNTEGEGPDAYETGITAGMPSFWKQRDIGDVKVSGSTSHDGGMFTLEGSGTNIGGSNDQFQFAYVTMSGDGTITARFVPQMSSQFSKLGLVMREDTTPGSAGVSFLVCPASTRNLEAPGYNVQLAVRPAAGADANAVATSSNVPAPYVANGRFMEPYWLRLVRSGDSITGSISSDGQNWMSMGTTVFKPRDTLLAGLAAGSRLTTVTTTIMFDNIQYVSSNR